MQAALVPTLPVAQRLFTPPEELALVGFLAGSPA
jgi:hypothetical protein